MDLFVDLAGQKLGVTVSPTVDGLREYTITLSVGDDEIEVQLYAADEAELRARAVPGLTALLPSVPAIVAGLGDLDADLASIILWRERLGLHFWSRSVNNEFTAIFTREPPHEFLRYGDVFAPGPA